MVDRGITVLMRWLRVPPQPDPPLGAPGSERLFRSGRNALRLSLSVWAFNQLFALAGIIFWFSVLAYWTRIPETPTRPSAPAPKVESDRLTDSESTPGPPQRKGRKKSAREVFTEISQKTPLGFILNVFSLIEGVAVVVFIIQVPVTYALRRLEYEQRWYIVTDRSLRLRAGVWNVQEITMSFANLQQITVSQGPLQRLLGLADVRVQSAGGGSGIPGKPESATHLGYFRSVDNADEIRDLITERLRKFRESGLGDPDEPKRNMSAERPSPNDNDDLSAARELLAEARALRQAFGFGQS